MYWISTSGSGDGQECCHCQRLSKKRKKCNQAFPYVEGLLYWRGNLIAIECQISQGCPSEDVYSIFFSLLPFVVPTIVQTLFFLYHQNQKREPLILPVWLWTHFLLLDISQQIHTPEKLPVCPSIVSHALQIGRKERRERNKKKEPIIWTLWFSILKGVDGGPPLLLFLYSKLKMWCACTYMYPHTNIEGWGAFFVLNKTIHLYLCKWNGLNL